MKLSQRIFVGTFKGLNRLVDWQHLPKWVGVANLTAFRIYFSLSSNNCCVPFGSA